MSKKYTVTLVVDPERLNEFHCIEEEDKDDSTVKELVEMTIDGGSNGSIQVVDIKEKPA